MDTNKKRQWEYFVRIMLTVIGSYGIIRVMTSCAQMRVSETALFICICIFSAVCIVGLYTKIFRKTFLISIAAVFGVSLIIFSGVLRVGIKCVYNDCVTALEIPYGLNLKKMQILHCSASNMEENITMIFLSAVVVFVVSAVVLYVHGMLGALLSVLPVLILFISMAVIPDIWSLALCIAYIFGVSAIHGEHGGEHQSVIILVICAAAAIAVTAAVPKDSFKRLPIFTEVNRLAKERFDWIGQAHHSNIAGIADGGINEGELGRVDGIKYTNETLFELRTISTGKNQYYPQYIGQIYSNNKWVEWSTSYNQDVTKALIDMIDYNKEMQEYVAGSQANYYDRVKRFDYSIEYKKGGKEAVDGSYIEVINPNYNSFKNIAERSVFFNSHTFGTVYSQAAYQKIEKSYRSNEVYNKFTYVDSGIRDIVANLIGNMSVSTQEQKEYYIKYVKEYLAENYTYNMIPGVVPNDKDFVTYFLTESKEGYCTYFATAAVMMYRCAGIPARYVEGYVVTDEKIRYGKPEKDTIERFSGNGNVSNYNTTYYTLEVSDTAAHAWVEVYMDGYGWIPVEVTPAAEGAGGRGETNTVLPNTNLQEAVQPQTQPSLEDNTAAEEEKPKESEETTTAAAVKNTDKNNIDIEKSEEVIKETVTLATLLYNNPIITAIISVIAVIMAAVLIVVLRYLIILKFKRIQGKKTGEMQAQQLALEIIKEYGKLEKILAYIGYNRTEGIEYEAYASYLEKTSQLLAAHHIKEITDLALRARFAKNTITADDLRKIRRQIRAIRVEVYNGLKLHQKIYFKYIRMM